MYVLYLYIRFVSVIHFTDQRDFTKRRFIGISAQFIVQMIQLFQLFPPFDQGHGPNSDHPNGRPAIAPGAHAIESLDGQALRSFVPVPRR